MKEKTEKQCNCETEVKVSEKAKSILFEHFSEFLKTIDTAEKRAAEFEGRLQQVKAELEKVKTAKCPVCSKSLPPDGKCYYCAAEQFPTSDKKLYRRACIQLFDLLLAYSVRGENVVHSCFFPEIAEALWDYRFEPDRTFAVKEMRTRIGSRCHNVIQNLSHSANTADKLTVTE